MSVTSVCENVNFTLSSVPLRSIRKRLSVSEHHVRVLLRDVICQRRLANFLKLSLVGSFEWRIQDFTDGMEANPPSEGEGNAALFSMAIAPNQQQSKEMSIRVGGGGGGGGGGGSPCVHIYARQYKLRCLHSDQFNVK